MRIFKNRGDIYFSKTNKKKSTEQKILLIALTVIVLFSVVFMFIVGAKNDFSAKNFLSLRIYQLPPQQRKARLLSLKSAAKQTIL